MLAVRGKPVFLHGKHATILEAAKREHSRKPVGFYALVEAMEPKASYALCMQWVGSPSTTVVIRSCSQFRSC